MESTIAKRFEKPHDVDGFTVILGAGKASELLPPMKDIPHEFKRVDGTKWNKVVCEWFFRGLKNAKWTPKPGIATGKALMHIKAIIGSFDPSHEHKEAGCAYLLSLWFEDVTYERSKG